MERVRWGNALRALAVVGVLGLVVAWPVLAPEAPRVPAGREVPVAVPSAVAPVVTPAPTARASPRRAAPRKAAPRPVRRRPERRVVRRERRAGRGGGGAERVVRRPAPAVAPAAPAVVPAAPVVPPAAAVAPPAAAPAPPDPDPVVREFSFENR